MSQHLPKNRFLSVFAPDAPKGLAAAPLDFGGPLGSLPACAHSLIRRERSLPSAGPLSAAGLADSAATPPAAAAFAGLDSAAMSGGDPLMLRLGLAAPEEDLLERIKSDAFWAPFEAPKAPQPERGGSMLLLDEWGAGFRREPGEVVFKAVWAPLAKATNMSDLKNHRWPRLDGSFDERWGRAAEKASALGDLALCFALKGVLEVAGDLRSHARAQAELSSGSPILGSIIERIAEAQILAYGRLISVLGEDLAMVAVTCDGLAPEHGLIDFAGAQGRVFPAQAMVFDSLASLGFGRVLAYGRGPMFVEAAASLAAAAIATSETPSPGSGKVWRVGPDTLAETNQESAFRAAAAWAQSLPPARLVLAPWFEIGRDATVAGVAMAASALDRVRSSQD